MEDQEIIALYLARSENAIAKTEEKYGRYCHSIAARILQSDADAEEIVSDTYLKVWNTVPPNHPTSLKSYVGMICRQLAFNAYEKRRTQKRGGTSTALVLDELEECIPDGDSREDIGESIALADALSRFLRKLPKKTRAVFLRRYYYSASVSEIAEEYGMAENHVSVLLFQARKKLKQYLNREGFDV